MKETTYSFYRTIAPLLKEGRIREMKNYIQHGSISTYHHSISVAYVSNRLNRFFRLNANESELIRGALLHDYFLYDWHDWDGELHGFYHPKAALKNAEKDFDLSEREKNIIRSHMWPLTFFNFPRSREAWIVCVADKICSTRETLKRRTGSGKIARSIGMPVKIPNPGQ